MGENANDRVGWLRNSRAFRLECMRQAVFLFGPEEGMRRYGLWIEAMAEWLGPDGTPRQGAGDREPQELVLS